MPLAVGQRVWFRPESQLYKDGLRSGTIVSVTEKFVDLLKRKAGEYGAVVSALEFLVTMGGLDRDLIVPVIRLDCVPAFPEMPDDFEVGIEDEHFQTTEPPATDAAPAKRKRISSYGNSFGRFVRELFSPRHGNSR
jgi:hypothetical protein